MLYELIEYGTVQSKKSVHRKNQISPVNFC